MSTMKREYFLQQQQQQQVLQLCHCSSEGQQAAIPVPTQFHLQVQLNLHHDSN